MFKILFDIILNLVATLLQIILTPLNLIISNAFPNISDTITQTASSLVTMFDGMGWAIGLIPDSVKAVLITILGLEIAKHSAYVIKKLHIYLYLGTKLQLNNHILGKNLLNWFILKWRGNHGTILMFFTKIYSGNTL